MKYAITPAILLCIQPVMSFTYTLTAYLPTSPLHGEVLNAASEGFYLGLDGPSAYCPITPSDCPAGNETILAGGLSPWVEVPGGQEGYIAPSGAVSYTQAHSIFMPINSTVGGWFAANVTSSCHANQTLLQYKPSAEARGGVFACPQVPEWINATYQIYVRTPLFNQTNCIELLGLLEHPKDNNDYGAWEYT